MPIMARTIPPLTGEATRALRALAGGGTLSAGRTYPFEHTFTAKRADKKRDGAAYTPFDVNRNTIAVLLEQGLIAATPGDDRCDRIEYGITDAGRAAVASGSACTTPPPCADRPIRWGGGMRPLRVLVACEFSGAVRDAFTARGHYARSCDLLPTESMRPVVFAGDLPVCDCCGEEPWCPSHDMHYGDCVCVGPTEDEAEYVYDSDGWDAVGARHHSGDLFSINFAQEGYDLLIAHPPCTRLTNSGVRWLDERNLWAEMYEAADFFRRILELPVPRIAVENPIPHRYAVERIGRRYDQIIQPWQFGHGETKATCLWLKGLPKLQPTNVVEGREARIHKLPPSTDRWKLRSMTYQGIADAMADQWGGREPQAVAA